MGSAHYLKIGDIFNDDKEIEETTNANQRDEPVFLEELRLLAKDPQKNPIKRKQIARQEQQRNEERQKKERQRAETIPQRLNQTFNNDEETSDTEQRPDQAFHEELGLLAKDPPKNPIKREQRTRQEQQINERQTKEGQQVKSIPQRPNEVQIQSSQCTPETSKLTLKNFTNDLQLCCDTWLVSKNIVTGRRRGGEIEKTQRRKHFSRRGQLHGMPDGYATEMESDCAYTVTKRCHSCQKWYNKQSERACPEDIYIQSSKYSALFRKKLSQEPQRVGYSMKKPDSLADFRTFFPIPCEEDGIIRERLNQSEPAKVNKQSEDLVSSNNEETVATKISSKEKRRSFRQRHNDTSKYNCSDRCCRCSGPVYMAEKRMAAGKKYHKQCFSCCSCAKLLDSFHLMEKDTEIYCRACYVQVSNN